MHRMPLNLPVPSISWDRNLPEYTLFDRTLNKCNVMETDKFLTILEHETEAYCRYAYNQVADQFVIVRKLLNSNDLQTILEGMRILNGIVIRAPKDSPVLPTALKLRGSCFFQHCEFEIASMDFEMFLHVGSLTNDLEEMCEINGNLVICYYLMRQYEKSKERLKVFNEYKAIIPLDLFQKPNLERTNRHILKFANELDNLDDIVPKFREDIYFCVPFKRFNTSEDIPLSSVACTYVKTTGVLANCTIPMGSVVLVEHPIVQSVDTPFVQCELCLKQREQIYTCLECRYKTYCSLKCMQKDEESHRHECVGYKYLILLILDATNLYRIFMRISVLLHEKVFTLKPFRKLTTAAAVLEKLQVVIDEQNMHGMQYLKLLATKPDYIKLTNMQYATLVATAFRLTIFIEKNTLVLESYYKKLRLSNKQKMIVVGAILMRLNCHLLNNTFDFEFNYPLQVKKPKYQTIKQQVTTLSGNVRPVHGGVIDNLNNHYNVDLQKDILLGAQYSEKDTANIFLPHAEQTQPCNPISRQLSTYKDNIAELYFNPDSEDFFLYGDAAGMPHTKTSTNLICTRIGEMCAKERYMFVQAFVRQFHLHFAEYFLQMNLRHNRIEQVIALLCTTLSKFRHSCDPNVEVIVMENGLVVGKALRDIQKAEKLLVPYKAHFMRHSKLERKQFLQKINLECNCKYCQMSEIEEPCNIRLGIFCDDCDFTKITPALVKCPTCRTSYNTLVMKYRTESKLIAKEICLLLKSDASERDLYVLYLKSYMHVRKCFVASNEFRIRVELEYAKFLALKNFAKQAYDIIVDVKRNLLDSYYESFIWFTLYVDILNVIKIILFYNMDQKLYSTSNIDLQRLCNFGLHIINGQLSHIQLYETFDYKSASILQDLHVFLDWKDTIPCNDLLPLSDTLHKSKKKNSGKTKAEIETMPTLSKTLY